MVVGNSAPAIPVPAGSQQIIGSHAISLFSIREIQLQKTNGAQRSDGAVTLADGTTIFNGTSGFLNDQQDGDIGSLFLIPSSAGYTSAKMYKGGINGGSNSVTYSISQGVYGVAAAAGAIASSGSATYAGDAAGIYKGPSGVSQYNSGTSSLAVNFQSKTADLSMSGFSVVNDRPFDTVSVTGMALAGNRLDGGAVRFTSGGSAVDLGANTQSTATGAFFGAVNGAGIPAEAGGQVYARGNDGAFIGTFIAK